MKLSTLIVIYTIWIHRTKINTRIIEPRNTYPPLFIPFFNSKKKKKEKEKWSCCWTTTFDEKQIARGNLYGHAVQIRVRCKYDGRSGRLLISSLKVKDARFTRWCKVRKVVVSVSFFPPPLSFHSSIFRTNRISATAVADRIYNVAPCSSNFSRISHAKIWIIGWF